ncbi:MAG: hypothetical protein LBG22_11065 [Treponema sp.]|nr:hypothetical protein [Treponema sp.]
MKKFLMAFILIVACTVTLVSCKKGDTNSLGQGDELYVIPMLEGSNNNIGIKRSDETKVGQYIKEKFNIVFEFSIYAGDLREKQSLMLAAGDYNEIQQLQRDDMVLNYANASALVDLQPYLEKMPNFKSRFAELIPYWRLICGGPLYKWETLVPLKGETDMEVLDVWVRSDLLEKAGWPLLRSASDYINFLERMVPGAVDVNGKPIVGMTMPLAESWGIAGIASIFYEKGQNYLPLSNEGFIFDHTNNRFVDYFQHQDVKDSYLFWSQLTRRGLFDLECYTDTIDITQEKASSGSTAAFNYVGWTAGGVNATLRAVGHPEMQYIELPIQSDAQVSRNEKRLVRVETTRSFDSYALTKNCKNPERVIQLLDWASSDEGQIILASGLEGQHWIRDSSGKRVWTDLFVQAKMDPDINKKEGIGFGRNMGLPTFHLSAADGQPVDLTNQMIWVDGQGLSDREREVFSKMGWASSKDWWLKNTTFGETGLAGTVYIDPASDLGAIHTMMTEIRVRHAANLMQAKSDEEFERLYRAAMTEYDRINHQSVIDAFNRQYQSRADELKKYQ